MRVDLLAGVVTFNFKLVKVECDLVSFRHGDNPRAIWVWRIFFGKIGRADFVLSILSKVNVAAANGAILEMKSRVRHSGQGSEENPNSMTRTDQMPRRIARVKLASRWQYGVERTFRGTTCRAASPSGKDHHESPYNPTFDKLDKC